ncbi:cholinephosphotransferase 1-like isoform X1 [Daphnia pulex]|uniref:cholinephosphotransferase 1-like isoform X1 n=1 Tax=Daphnia pulex TaxID=6669 RepID=UPI001EDCA4C8|nr:cholinephosphotransferase 1-like isoform X1 [Daphnia pulex]XP_046459528.1 cholinephosphotransferase 1-like isoform X1 [Daphnia pulex]XP_046647419.1 cholinephosphotransferase 1-like isoform X1 [Daphnia pulicaria]XP_046647420.1 cholinephosphotransferase 1-like isoform X1 [Daphnia pulicaria]
MKFKPVLDDTQLKRLSEHKYSCTSSSILEPFLQPWWNWVVQCLPLWLAPNLITITGLFVNILTSLVLVYYNPDGKEESPRWAALMCAAGIFIYQTLDAIDGKQARRTNSSSPLGELFDHGCDSLSTVFVALAACVTVGLGTHPWWMFFQCFTGFALFYCAHWQTYVSGTLRFGKIDVTEAQYGIMGLHLLTFIFGSNMWQQNLPMMGFGWNIAVVVSVFLAQSYTFFTEYLGCILSGGTGKNGSTIAGTSVLSPAIPLGLVIVPAYIIACKSEEHIFEEHPSLYIIAFGLVVAKVTNRLVVAHMTRSEMDYLDSVLIGPALLFLNQYFNNFIQEYYVLWLCLLWAAIDLYRYCHRVCLEICGALNIELFRIKARLAVPAGAASAALDFAAASTNSSRNGRHRRT